MPYDLINGVMQYTENPNPPHPVEKDGRLPCEFCAYKKSFPSKKSRDQHYKYFHRFDIY